MNWEFYISFIIAAMGLTIMPGPDNLFVLSESILRGHQRGISLSAGLASGVMVHTFLAASGLAWVLQANPMVFALIMTAGAFYLLFLAWSTFKEKSSKLDLEGAAAIGPIPSFWSSFRKGFLMNVLNPKVTIFFLALLPQFVDRGDAWPPFGQMVFMGFSFMLQAFIIFSVIAFSAGRLAQYLESPGFQSFSRWFQIAILLLLALGLLFSAWFR